MSTTSRVAGAVAAGYALGRFKKLRLAVLVATAMSSPKFRAAAAGMLQDRLPGGAITGTLTKEVGGKLVNVGKTAATSIVASRIDSLSQSLADRSENLRKATPGGQGGKSRAGEYESKRTKSRRARRRVRRARRRRSRRARRRIRRARRRRSRRARRRIRRARRRRSRRAHRRIRRARRRRSRRAHRRIRRARRRRSRRAHRRI